MKDLIKLLRTVSAPTMVPEANINVEDAARAASILQIEDGTILKSPADAEIQQAGYDLVMAQRNVAWKEIAMLREALEMFRTGKLTEMDTIYDSSEDEDELYASAEEDLERANVAMSTSADECPNCTELLEDGKCPRGCDLDGDLDKPPQKKVPEIETVRDHDTALDILEKVVEKDTESEAIIIGLPEDPKQKGKICATCFAPPGVRCAEGCKAMPGDALDGTD